LNYLKILLFFWYLIFLIDVEKVKIIVEGGIRGKMVYVKWYC